MLSALAVLKAIQKLENAADRGREVAQGAAPIELPTWVREGLWPTLHTLMSKAPPSPRRGEGGFVKEVDKMSSRYLRWAKIRMYAAKHSVSQAAAVRALEPHNPEAFLRSFQRAQREISEELERANRLDCRDEEGAPLQPIEARDLFPTQKIEELLKMID